NIDDPSDNVDGGVRYLKYLMEKFDSKLPLVLAAYNAGENVVRRYNGIPPYKETKRYVKKVLAYKKQYTEGGR
ncbi:MAG: lytic transglycosylase domain-containing protein, partial [Deltaproteobacteria bacterium]|nr:lytic transglycosylase domain-containing protein [Deltaproteobacteria bacterium]